MQKRAGILFISKETQRILLILDESQKWTIPTFKIESVLLEDAQKLIQLYHADRSKLVPIELYLSQDKGFEYGTYICLVDQEFLTSHEKTISWASLDFFPKQLHTGLKNTLTNAIIRSKIDTVIALNIG